MKNVCLSITFLLGVINLSVAQDFFLPVSSTSKTAIEAYHQADKLASNADLTGAMEQLDKAIKADPNFFMAHVLSVFIASDEASEVMIDKALALNAKQLNHAEKIMRELLVALDKDPKTKTADSMQKLVAAYPSTPQAYEWAISLLSYRDGDIETALDYSHKMIVLSPDFAPVYNVQGYAYLSKKDMNKAKAAFDSYIALAPKEANPYDSMADYFMATKDFAKAAEYYDKAVERGMAGAKERAENARKAMNEKP